MSFRNLNHHHSHRCRCRSSCWKTIIIITVILLLKQDINLYSSRSIDKNPTHIFVTAFVTGPATTSPPLASIKSSSNVNRNQNKMSHRVSAVKKLQASLIRQHRQVVAAASAGTTSTTKSEENDNSKSHGSSTTTKTTTTNAPRTRHSRQPLSPLQRRIFDDVYTSKTNSNSINRPPVTPPAIRRIELSTTSSVLSIRGGGSGNKPVTIIPLLGEIRHPLYQSIITFGICDLVGLMISLASKGTHIHLDLIGTGAFAIVSGQYMLKKLLSSSSSSSSEVMSTSSCISSIAVWVWAMKLTAFLTYRAFCVKEDSRLTETLNTVSGSIQFWVITWIWNVLTSLPYILALASNASSRKLAIVVGLSLYLVGLTTETLADGQKWFFKQQSSDSSSFCNVGLWKYSQHPNFVGNLMLWCGIFLMNISGLVDPLPRPIVSNWSTISFFRRTLWRIWKIRKLVLATLSPLFLWTLFSGQANGTITSAKALADTKYGDDPDYVKYIEETPTMFPNLFGFLTKRSTNDNENDAQEM